jgi:[glutamine synthetase] adenylyltransferase / [glutamine synthetase]-adenylyl-L-tyrosine phosphorylase
VLDPAPSDEQIEQVLGCYGFKNLRDAYTHLMALTTERISILSTRRCRHFLAAIAPQLLQAISETPDPDSTLINLEPGERFAGRQGRVVGIVQTERALDAACTCVCARRRRICRAS